MHSFQNDSKNRFFHPTFISFEDFFFSFLFVVRWGDGKKNFFSFFHFGSFSLSHSTLFHVQPDFTLKMTCASTLYNTNIIYKTAGLDERFDFCERENRKIRLRVENFIILSRRLFSIAENFVVFLSNFHHFSVQFFFLNKFSISRISIAFHQRCSKQNGALEKKNV